MVRFLEFYNDRVSIFLCPSVAICICHSFPLQEHFSYQLFGIDLVSFLRFLTDNATDGQHLPGSKTSRTFTSGPPQERKKSIPGNRSALPDGSVSTTARKRSSLDTSDKKSGQAMFRKLDRKKPTDWKVEISANHSPSTTVVCEDDPRGRYEKGEKLRSQVMISETRRALFDRNADDKMFKFGGAKAGSQVVPCEGDNSASTVGVSEITENVCKNQKESEDLSLIREQLVQIENQQSGLLDLLQVLLH